MTTDQIRAHFAAITLPQGEFKISLHITVLDASQYISTQIERLDSVSPALRRLAYIALKDIAEKLNHPFIEE